MRIVQLFALILAGGQLQGQVFARKGQGWGPPHGRPGPGRGGVHWPGYEYGAIQTIKTQLSALNHKVNNMGMSQYELESLKAKVNALQRRPQYSHEFFHRITHALNSSHSQIASLNQKVNAMEVMGKSLASVEARLNTLQMKFWYQMQSLSKKVEALGHSGAQFADLEKKVDALSQSRHDIAYLVDRVRDMDLSANKIISLDEKVHALEHSQNQLIILYDKMSRTERSDERLQALEEKVEATGSSQEQLEALEVKVNAMAKSLKMLESRGGSGGQENPSQPDLSPIEEELREIKEKQTTYFKETSEALEKSQSHLKYLEERLEVLEKSKNPVNASPDAVVKPTSANPTAEEPPKPGNVSHTAEVEPPNPGSVSPTAEEPPKPGNVSPTEEEPPKPGNVSPTAEVELPKPSSVSPTAEVELPRPGDESPDLDEIRKALKEAELKVESLDQKVSSFIKGDVIDLQKRVGELEESVEELKSSGGNNTGGGNTGSRNPGGGNNDPKLARQLAALKKKVDTLEKNQLANLKEATSGIERSRRQFRQLRKRVNALEESQGKLSSLGNSADDLNKLQTQQTAIREKLTHVHESQYIISKPWINGRRYYLSLLDVVDIHTAQDRCEHLGGYLVRIEGRPEYKFVTHFISRYVWPRRPTLHVYLGGTYQDVEGEWVHIHGGDKIQKLGKDYPGAGDNNGVTENCLDFVSKAKKVNHVPCKDHKRYHFICEVPGEGEKEKPAKTPGGKKPAKKPSGGGGGKRPNNQRPNRKKPPRKPSGGGKRPNNQRPNRKKPPKKPAGRGKRPNNQRPNRKRPPKRPAGRGNRKRPNKKPPK